MHGWMYVVGLLLTNLVIAGVFPLTEFEGDIVLSLRTDPQENHLIAGDTSGSISVFEISHYGTAPIQVPGTHMPHCPL